MYLTNKLIDALPKRIVSAIVDLFSLALASMIFSAVEDLTFTRPVYTAIVLFSIFLNKDIFFGKSIGKYFTGTRVVSARTGNAASPIQCSIRNLFILIWPLEAIILLFSPKRRIGDIVAGTKVQESAEIGPEMKWQYAQAILSVVASFAFVYYLFTFIDGLGIMS
jgi:uncharacterized RDD family membrane protein YckC